MLTKENNALFSFVSGSFCTFVASRVITLEHNNEELRNTNGCYLVTQFSSNPTNRFILSELSFLAKVTEIFCISDDFCKLYDQFIKANGLAPKLDKSKRKYHRDPRMSSAEIIIIMILFHLSGYKCFKHFYINEVQEHMTDIFPKTVAYNRFTELERTVVIQFILFVKRCCMGKCTGWQDRQARCKHRQELSKSAGT